MQLQELELWDVEEPLCHFTATATDPVPAAAPAAAAAPATATAVAAAVTANASAGTGRHSFSGRGQRNGGSSNSSSAKGAGSNPTRTSTPPMAPLPHLRRLALHGPTSTASAGRRGSSNHAGSGSGSSSSSMGGVADTAAALQLLQGLRELVVGEARQEHLAAVVAAVSVLAVRRQGVWLGARGSMCSVLGAPHGHWGLGMPPLLGGGGGRCPSPGIIISGFSGPWETLFRNQINSNPAAFI